MSGRGGRDRSRRDHPPSGRSSRSNAPPSRHLWVGNISHSILEPDLTEHFLQFGELESVAFQPGRSYAFINFMNDEEAISAMRALQGFPVAGNPLRIEFAKADKSSTPSRDEDYLPHRDEQRSKVRSPFSSRDNRARRTSPERFTHDKSKGSDRSGDPSEVLWIGFPASLKVDEMILKKAFSPFGEIEKITVFPGRSYAFVRFTRLSAACRAKETLQGKLFGNPRVHICFAKSDGGSSSGGRGSVNSPNSPHFRSNGRLGSSENFLHDRSYSDLPEDASIRSPYMSTYDSGDDVYSFKRKGNLWTGGNTYEPRRFGEGEPDPRVPQDIYEHSKSPIRYQDYPPKLPQKNAFYEEPWDMPEDNYPVHGAKKMRTGSFPPEKELPEYNLSDLEQEKRVFPRMLSDIPQPEAFDKHFEPAALGYKQVTDRQTSFTSMRGERNNHWKPSYDDFPVGSVSGSLQSNIAERKRFTQELDQPSLKEWKWEGTIAKGGTPVCRARCFPVGTVLDMMLPEFLDCTARTGLDMLAKHYYQASSAWVVFFVPESDDDMGFYNEFMNYLGEKQRAAVSKLDDKTTLFLVPPSDFSEKVLKVPGKLSISGVILRLDHSGSTSSAHPSVRGDSNSFPFYGDTSFAKPSTTSGPFPSMPYPELSRQGIKDSSYSGNGATSAPPVSLSGPAHSVGNVSDLYHEQKHDYAPQQNAVYGPGWSSLDQQRPASVNRNGPQVSGFDPAIQGHQSVMPRAVQETYSSTSGSSGIPLSGNSKPSMPEFKSPSMPINALQPEQLAQLASSLIGQQGQVGNVANASMGENFQHTNTMDHSDMMRLQQGYGLQNNQAVPELSASQFSQLQQLQQQQTWNSAAAVSQETQRSQLQGTGITEEGDGDPQKRLQATLQLAAALLQQIQQGKGT
ncbi:flowering time control protein FPA-like [Hibiscus syriacus]|uniref:flowering time control protein FPA-like n=1 Tax=Hibiscus syriacus TaxID=106335 RepID=UPI001922BE4A|nr:flowering time control protein FPA-like [Hibiscus syriacus]XP_039041360.1 flowering time control protein FPA-like [Hibiscus syriacus]